MDPYQQQAGQYSAYVQPYQAYLPTTTPTTAYYPPYQSYQQQPFAAYQPVPGTFPATQPVLGAQPAYPQVGYYAQPSVVVPVVQPPSSISTSTTAPTPTTFVAASVPPVSTSQAQPSSESGQGSQEQEKYKEQYEQWQQQYKKWLEQNQNHPDQKQFQQWQQQMQHWQKQYSQILTTEKSGDHKLEPSSKQPKLQPEQENSQPQTRDIPPKSQPVNQTTNTTLPQTYAPNAMISTAYLQPAQPVGLPVAQFGNQFQPVGQQSQIVTHHVETPSQVTQSQNVAQPPQNIAQAQNIAQTQNPGYQTQHSGYQTQNSGYQHQNIGYQMPKSGPQAQNLGHQNQQTGYHVSHGQSPSLPPSKPPANQGYNQPGNQGYNQATNNSKFVGDRPSMPPSQYPPAEEESYSEYQQDYNEYISDEDRTYQYGSEDITDDGESGEDYHAYPPPPQYRARPPRPLFNEQNRFRPCQGMPLPRSPRPYEQFRQQSPNQIGPPRAQQIGPPRALRPRGQLLRGQAPGSLGPRGPAPRGPAAGVPPLRGPAPGGLSPRGPRIRTLVPSGQPPRGPAPRSSRPPFPDQFVQLRSPRPERPPFQGEGFERQPRMRPPTRPLLEQNVKPPNGIPNFNARDPRPQEPRLRPPAPQVTRLRPPTTQVPRSRPPTPHELRLRAPTPHEPRFRPPVSQEPRLRTPTPQEPRLRSPAPQQAKLRSPAPQQTRLRLPAPQQPRSGPLTPQEPRFRPQAPGLRPPTPQAPRFRPPTSQATPPQAPTPPALQAPRSRQPTPPENKDHIRPQQPITQPVPPRQPLVPSLGEPVTGSPVQPKVILTAKPDDAPVPQQKPQASPQSKDMSLARAATTAQPLNTEQTAKSSPSTDMKQTVSTDSNNSNKNAEIKSNKTQEQNVGESTVPAKETAIQQKTEKNNDLPKTEITKQEISTTEAPSKGLGGSETGASQNKVASMEIEILKRQQDQLNKLKELGIRQKFKTKPEDTKNDEVVKKEVASSGTNKEMKEGKSEQQTERLSAEKLTSERNLLPCKKFPDCGLAENCEFYHPLCKFDSKCKKPDCPFWHTVPLEDRYCGKKMMAIRDGSYFEDNFHDVPEHSLGYGDRDGLRTGYPYGALRPERDRLPSEDPYYRDHPLYPRGYPDHHRELYDDRGFPPRERDEFDRRRYDDLGLRDRFERRSPLSRFDRDLERDRDFHDDRFPPPRDYERYPDEPRPFRDRLIDRGLDPYERDRMYHDVDREYFDRLNERELLERDFERRYEDDPILLEREREWRSRGYDRKRDSYDDPYLRDPLYGPRDRPPLYDLPERYPEDYERRRDRDWDILDLRRPYDRDFRHLDDRDPRYLDDELARDRYLDERELLRHREAFDYNHGDRGERDSDRESRKLRDLPEKSKPKPKPKVTAIGTLLDTPGRDSRPDRIVFIFRGVPGCGKTHIARLIKDKELASGAPTPRILSLDDYFLQETTTYERDPETGKKVQVKGTEYIYEAELEESYRNSLFKAFSKTLDDGFFPMVILDCVNDKVEHFERFWSQAKQKGFEVYVAEITADPNDCAKRNTHHRTLEEINEMLDKWEETPVHHTRLDVRSLLQEAAITEVEMEAIEEPEESKEADKETSDEKEEEDPGGEQEDHLVKSRWDDIDATELQLDKLDGLRSRGSKRKAHGESPLADFDVEDDPYDEREEDMRLGKKRVRWADIEERKHLEHRRKIGFCIGTDWSLFTNPDAEIPQ